MDPRVLNVGLKLAMEFGEHWLRPIQSRLSKQFPDLSSTELDAYDAACRTAIAFGHDQVRSARRSAAGSQHEALRAFRDVVRARFTWIDDDNLSHLFSQGCYYAWKDGELP